MYGPIMLWSAAESRLHINHLELLTVLKTMHYFTCHLRMKTIALHLDNVTATSYLNKEDGTRSAALNRLTLDILKFCQSHCITLIPAYLPEVANLGADALLMGQVSREWFLNPSLVKKIFKILGRPQVDCSPPGGLLISPSTSLWIGETGSQQDSMPWIRIGISGGCMSSLHLN